MSDIVTVAAIVSGTQLVQFFVTRRDTKKLQAGLKEVVHATNSIVAQGKVDAEKIGNLKGRAEEKEASEK